MIKTILAHLTGTDCDAAVLAAGLDLARPHGAHIACIGIAPDPADLVRQAAYIDVASATLLAESLRAVEKLREECSARIQAAFNAFRDREHVALADSPPGPGTVSASLREALGNEAEILSAQGRFHDLVVLAGGPERSGRLIAADIGEVVVTCGRSVLLVPEKAHLRDLKTIAIAWKNAPEAARAVTAAMPLLTKAKRIEVLSANEDSDGSLECVNCSDSVVGQLRWHGLNTHGHFVIPGGRSIPDAILETARERDADLLVMGAYGHSRLREFVFGGFTRRILDGASLPVLLFH